SCSHTLSMLFSFPTRRSSDLGFSNEGNSSGDATMLWVKISKTDYSFTEGQWTLSNAHLMDVGNRELGSFPERYVKCCVRNGYLRSEEHTSELQSRFDLVCRLL